MVIDGFLRQPSYSPTQKSVPEAKRGFLKYEEIDLFVALAS